MLVPELGDWPPAWAQAAETRVVFPWYVVVATADSYGWHTPWTGVTDTEITATAGMCEALRRHGPGGMGVVKRALHRMYDPDYEYFATVCTAVIDPSTGLIVVGGDRR